MEFTGSKRFESFVGTSGHDNRKKDQLVLNGSTVSLRWGATAVDRLQNVRLKYFKKLFGNSF